MGKGASPGARGFTLVEVMIAALILGLVLAIAARAASNFTALWQKDSRLFARELDSARYRMLLRQSMEAAYGYYVKAPSGWSDQTHVPFFKGEPQAITFVTLSSVFSHGAPAVARLYARPGDGGNYDLVYQEASLESFFIKTWAERISYSRQAVIEAGLSDLSFRYYGVIDQKPEPEGRRVTDIYGWEGRYSGKEFGRLPDKIEIRLGLEEDGRETRTFGIQARSAYKNRLFNPPFKD